MESEGMDMVAPPHVRRLRRAEDAYQKGWAASARTLTGDLDAAETRFLRRYGHEELAAFVAGWSDRATNCSKWTSLNP
jgi:hypothetical protein